MILSFILALMGLFLILLEFYLPGAILGTLGGIAIVAAVVLFAANSSSLLATILFVAGVAVAVGLLIRFALWRIVHTKPESSIYSDKDQEGYQASFFDKSAIGKMGTVLTDLKPGGFVLIEGQQHAAISVSGYISKDEQIMVIGGQEQSLLVKSSKKKVTS